MIHIPPSLRQRRFTIFWFGIIFGWIGNQVLVWAIPWHIRSLTDNPLALGWIGVIRLVPTLLLSLFAGVLADQVSRRKIVFFTQGTMGLVALALAFLSRFGTIQLWHIYLLLAAHATAYTFDLPARYSLTPNLVSKKNLANALSVEFMGIQVGSLLGPIISGSLIDRFGQVSAYFCSASLFGLMLVALLILGNIPQRVNQPAQTGIDWPAIRTGVRFTFGHALIAPGMLLDFFATMLTRADSLMPYFARDILGLNASQYGWLSAATAIGAITSGLVLSQVKTLRRQGATLIAAVGIIGIGAILFGFSRWFPLSMAALILVGASDSTSSIIRSTIRQQHTNDDLRGRMTSVNQIFFMGGPYLGDVKSGFIGSLIGVPLAVALGGMACILSTTWIAHRWPALRSYQSVDAGSH
jgi:MFS family permease